MSFWRVFDDEDSGYSVVLEDDDRVAWAYIRDREAGGNRPLIVADVWLYNVAAPPDSWVRPTPGEAPLNPSPYVSQERAMRLEEAREIIARWNTSDGARIVDVLVDGVLYGRLSPGSKPGWSRFAAAESPVARPL